uniref:Variant surface glycoprotein n=1 Tax=Trypanosoma brucei TaxID=5691 RepID=A0A1V0FXY0_9TRYP|nr:variant surface glycoprotein [Trypanosoma brucei]
MNAATTYLLLALAAALHTRGAPHVNCTGANPMVYVGEHMRMLKNLASVNTEHQVDALKLRVAAALTGDARRAGLLRALANLKVKCHDETTSATLTAQYDAATKVSAMATMAGIATATATVADMEIADVAFADGSGTAPKHLRIKPDGTATGLTTSKCSLQDYLKHEGPADSSNAHAKWQINLKVVTIDTTDGSQNAAQAMCCATNSNCGSSTQGTKVGIKKGKIYKAEAPANQATGKTKGPAAKKTIEWHFPNADLAYQCAKADTELHEAVAKPISPRTPCNAWDRKTDPKFSLAVYKILNADAEARTVPSQKQSDVATAIETTFGKNTQEFETKIWKGVKDTKITKANAGHTTDTTLENVNSLDELRMIEAFIESKKAIRSESLASGPQNKCAETVKEAANCEGKEKDVCNKKPGCKYNDGENKCEEDPAKTTVAATKDDKTNTTGSSSFVIRKAPLWLAFLLF